MYRLRERTGVRVPSPEFVAEDEFDMVRTSKGRNGMSDKVREDMEVIGADGVHVGTVDRVGHHEGHHHYIEMGFVAGVEGEKVRLSANADVAVTLEEEQSGRPVDL